MSKFWINAPPPAKYIPFSTKSAASSGGVFSNVCFTVSIIFAIDSLIASIICDDLIIIFLGNPDTKSLPLISICISVINGVAQPICIFICSAVVSPIDKFSTLLI